MKNQFAGKLQEGDRVNDYFVATRRDLRTKQDGGKFLGMVFKDSSGEIGGIMWTNAVETAKMFEVGDVVKVRGLVGSYQGRPQVRAEHVLPLNEGEYVLEDLVATPENSGEDLKALETILRSIQNPWLRKLTDAFLNDKTLRTMLLQASAAKKWHHEYRGGLVRHCYEMARLGEVVCELYPEIDRDLLLTGVLLHDIGKLKELTHDLFVDYTTDGRLLGHLHIGCAVTQKKIDAIEGFPEHLKTHLLHLILSHHGSLENGSPVLPKSIEAIVLHHLDDLDAQTAATSRIRKELANNGEEWSDYQPLIERMIWFGKGGHE